MGTGAATGDARGATPGESQTARLRGLVSDLAAEADALDVLLSGLAAEQWFVATPALGWDVRDSITHVAIGNELAYECVTRRRVPKLMQDGLEAVLEGQAAAKAFELRMLGRGRQMSADDVHRWWRTGNASLCDVLAGVDPSVRLPWGPNRMSPASFTTARVMETWAHGLDCFDAVGAEPVYTDRLHHVADLSVRALPYAFMINGLDAPGAVRVELQAPSGASWTIGPDDAPTVITGTAADWCRVAVHRDRTGERSRLHGSGPDAADVIKYAQAYL
jgi:uncharacterized protein (TIGR03084 family)